MSVSRLVESVCSNVKHASLLLALAGSVAGISTREAKGDVDFSFSLSFGNVFSWCEPVYVCPPPVVVTPVYCPPPVVVHRPWSYCPPTYYYSPATYYPPVYSHWRGWDDCDDRWVYRPVTSVTTTTYFGHYSSYSTTYSSFGHGYYNSYRRPVYYCSGLSLNFFFGDDDDDCDRDWRYDHYRRDRHDRDWDHRDRGRDRDYGRGRDNQPIFQTNNNVTVNNFGPVGPQTIQQVGPVGPNAGGIFPASNVNNDAGGNASGFAAGPVTGLDGREGPRSQAKPLRFASEQEARASDRARDRDRTQQASKPVFAPEPVRVAEVENQNQNQPQAFGPVGPSVSKPVVRRPVESVGKQPPATRPQPAPKPLRNQPPAFASAPQQPVSIPVQEPVVKPATSRPSADTWEGPRGPQKPVVATQPSKPSRAADKGRQPTASRPVFESGEVRVEQPRAPRQTDRAPAFAPKPSPSIEAGPRPSSKPMRSASPASRPAFEQPREAPQPASRPSLKPSERPARLSDMQRPSSKPRRPADEKK